MKLSSSASFPLFLALLLPVAALPLLAQSAAPNPATASPTSTAAATASPSSSSRQPANTPHLATRPLQPPPPPDLADLQSLLKLMRVKTTTPAQVVEAVRQYTDKYPTSAYRQTAYTLGMEFARSRRDYPDMLSFGDAALKVNPKALVPLLLLGSVIPARVHPTDINREQQLDLAASYNHRALAIAQNFPSVYNGHQLAPQQVAEIQREIRASAYSSLGIIAMDRAQYTAAVSSLQQAIQYDNAHSKPFDYYHLGIAQASLKQYPAALASLHQALTLGANDPTLQTLGKAEVDKVQRLQGVIPKPAAAPVTPAAPATPHLP